jgi:hypothetical protein
MPIEVTIYDIEVPVCCKHYTKDRFKRKAFIKECEQHIIGLLEPSLLYD